MGQPLHADHPGLKKIQALIDRHFPQDYLTAEELNEPALTSAIQVYDETTIFTEDRFKLMFDDLLARDGR